MTYCTGVLLDDGIVFAADSRTNAGIDQVSTYSKLHAFEREGDRVLVLLSQGTLAVTQALVSLLREGLGGKDESRNLHAARTMFRAARVVGNALREVHATDAEALAQHHTDFSASFILGGQIKGEAPRLFLIYVAGNFIEATRDTPFFQIGESKYGKPALDRLVALPMALRDAAKLVLVSFDAAMRSNVSVGMPIDMVCYRRDSLRIGTNLRIEESDPYFQAIREGWGDGLQQVFHSLPDPDFVS